MLEVFLLFTFFYLLMGGFSFQGPSPTLDCFSGPGRIHVYIYTMRALPHVGLSIRG